MKRSLLMQAALGLMACTAMDMVADKLEIFNGYKGPLYVALVQVVGGKSMYKSISIKDFSKGQIPVYTIEPYTKLSIERPSWGEKTVLKDTELFFSTSLDVLRDVINSGNIPAKKTYVQPGGVGRFKVGQTGSKKVYIYEDTTTTRIAVNEAEVTSYGLTVTKSAKKMADKLGNPSKSNLTLWPNYHTDPYTIQLG